MGDRWVSPPTFVGTRQKGNEYTLEARVNGIDMMGRSVPIRPEWTLCDPEMVKVNTRENETVQIIVRQAGESRVKLATQGLSKHLRIMATREGDTMQVQVFQ